MRSRQINRGNFTSAQKQRSNALKLFGCGKIAFGRGSLRDRQCQSVISLEHGLGQGSACDFGAGVRRREQRAIFREGRAELSGNIKVSRDIHQCLVLADRIVRDKTRRSRLTRLQTKRRRGVNVAQRRAHLRQKSSLCLPYILSRDLLVQPRLLESRRLRSRQTKRFLEREPIAILGSLAAQRNGRRG